MIPVQEAVAISDFGLEGDRHAKRGGPRQVLLADIETLKSHGLSPGIIKENITIEGVDLFSAEPGQVFFIGDQVTMEVTGECVPCSRMDEIRTGLQEELDGRRGILVIVLNGGSLRVGDAVRLEAAR